MTRPGYCPVCPDPTCPVREGSIASAYHALEMLREAYRMNGTPRTDAELMGLARPVPEVMRIPPANESTPWPDADVVMFDASPRPVSPEYMCVYPNEEAS